MFAIAWGRDQAGKYGNTRYGEPFLSNLNHAEPLRECQTRQQIAL
jgi:hypothetical protein